MKAGEALVQYVITKYFGLAERNGPEEEKVIAGWIEQALNKKVDDADSTIPWCSIAISAWLIENNYPITYTLLARSWLEWGTPIDKPETGDLVIFWRKHINSTWGHVGLYIREDDKGIFVLGGNQGDMVNIQRYAKDRVLGYRRLPHAAGINERS